MSRRKYENEQELVDIASQRRAEGISWYAISLELGPEPDWFKRRLIPGFADRLRNRQRAQYSGVYNLTFAAEPRPISNDELEKRKEMIPLDTRDLTARMMGDPIPGDRRRQLCGQDA